MKVSNIKLGRFLFKEYITYLQKKINLQSSKITLLRSMFELRTKSSKQVLFPKGHPKLLEKVTCPFYILHSKKNLYLNYYYLLAEMLLSEQSYGWSNKTIFQLISPFIVARFGK